MKKVVYVSHPISGDMDKNIGRIHGASRQIYSEGNIPFAPYLLFMEFLDEMSQDERKAGLEMNLEMKTENKIFWSALVLVAVYSTLLLVPTPVNFSLTGYVAEGRLPTVGGDSGNWGTILNTYLQQEHDVNGSHRNVTVNGYLNVTGDVNVSGIVRSNNWSNVSITESQISDLQSYRTNDNLTFVGNVNITGNLTISGNISDGTPAKNTLYAKALPKAWVNFDGTDCGGGAVGSCDAAACTIKDSFNIDCVNRSSTGRYVVFWDTDFANANYVYTGSSAAVSILALQDPTVGSAIVDTNDMAGGNFDSSLVTVIAFGEQ